MEVFSPVEVFSIFDHPAKSRFLRGLINLFPQISEPTPAWDFNFILTCLIKHPFELLATCWLLHLSKNTAFLVAITSVQRVEGLGLLMADSPPPTVFFKGKISLQPHLKILPKMSYEFHINQTIHLSFSPLKPHQDREEVCHTLDVTWALAFYQDRIKPFRKSPRLSFNCKDPQSPPKDW